MQVNHCICCSIALLTSAFFVVHSHDRSPGRSLFVVLAGGIMLIVVWLGTAEYKRHSKRLVFFGANVALGIGYFSVVYRFSNNFANRAMLIGGSCLAHMVGIGFIVLYTRPTYQAVVQVFPLAQEVATVPSEAASGDAAVDVARAYVVVI